MPAEFHCPNGHLVIHGGPGDDGTRYNCGLCIAEGKEPHTFDLPDHLKQHELLGADTTHPVEIRTVAVPEGPIRIELPGQTSGEAQQPPSTQISVRELAEAIGAGDLRVFLAKLRAAGLEVQKGDDMVPASLKDQIELVPAGA